MLPHLRPPAQRSRSPTTGTEDIENEEPDHLDHLTGNFEEITYSSDDDTDTPATVLLINTRCDGTYVVEARFCDYLDNGSLEVCEIRISVHGHEHDGEEVEA